METAMQLSQGLRRFLYLNTPAETSFETIAEVPDYLTEAIPYFIALLILEVIVLAIQGKELPRGNDALSSISAGLISMMHGLLLRAVELVCYVWVYNHCCLVSLPWDSHLTWLLGFISVDFLYYWVHRSGHEVNIMWAWHQAHHSSEDYNFTTALRQSAFFRYFSWVFYMPMALCVPPSIFCVHNQFNLLYQFWIHTETIEDLGPLEYVINTPSHHRVHHGRNPYCIDKNYGGTLIIWDRIFGTFQKEEDRVVYGLVHPLTSWEPINIQLCHLLYIIKTSWATEGFANKMAVFWKGPGWSPGKPRLGLKEELPDVELPVEKYNSSVTSHVALYIWTHFAIILAGYLKLVLNRPDYSELLTVACVAYMVFSLSAFGLLYDNWKHAPVMEVVRCVVFIVSCEVLDLPDHLELSLLSAVYIYHVVSVILWLYHIHQQRKLGEVKKQV